MIKNLVFDMGGVCGNWNEQELAACLYDTPDKQRIMIEELFHSPEWPLLDKGILTAKEAEERLKLRKHNDITVYALYHWYDYFHEFEDMKELIHNYYEQGFKIYLLSNTSYQFYDFKDKFTMFKYFTSCYTSADHHLVKPDQEIFIDFLNENKLKAEECIFIDDAKANIETADSLGYHGYYYDGNIEKLNEYIKKETSQ